MNNEQVIELFLAGDNRGSTAVFGWVEKVVLYRGWGNIDRDNLNGEIILAVLQNLKWGRFKGENLKAYVEGIAKKKCLEEYRKMTRRKDRSLPLDIDPEDPKPGPQEELEQTEQYELLKRIWWKMSWACKKMLVMKIEQGLDFVDIAARLGIKEGTARVRLHRCIEGARQLRLSLEGV